MDIISYAKASQTLKGAKKYDTVTVAPGAEDRFETVDERIDYLENKLVGHYEDKVIDIDLTKGTFTNTELNESGELQLKVIGLSDEKIVDSEYTPGTNGALNGFLVERTTPVFGAGYDIDNLFDKIEVGDTSRYIGKNIYPNIFTFVNPNPIMLDKYMLCEKIYPNGAPKNWTVEGSDDKTNWTIIDTVEGNNMSTIWKTFETDLKQPFLYHRFVFTANNRYSGYGVSITEMRLFRGPGYNYVRSGEWESDVIDLGEDYLETHYLNIDKIQIPPDQTIKSEISYSSDGVIFTPFITYEGNIQNYRFIKIRIDLKSENNVIANKNYDYSHEENNEFEYDEEEIIQTNRITLNTSKSVISLKNEDGHYETNLTNINKITKVDEVF